MTFIDFIHDNVSDEKFKKAIDSLYILWKESYPDSDVQMEADDGSSTDTKSNSVIPGNTASTSTEGANTSATSSDKDWKGAFNLNNLDATAVTTVASRLNDIEKAKADAEKYAASAKDNIDKQYAEAQNLLNASASSKSTTNTVG